MSVPVGAYGSQPSVVYGGQPGYGQFGPPPKSNTGMIVFAICCGVGFLLLTPVLVGVLYLWVTNLADTEPGTPLAAWDVSDAAGYEVNSSTSHQNVLLRVELISGTIDISQISLEYRIDGIRAGFSLRENTTCQQDWSDARTSGVLFDPDGWDSTSTCIQASGGANGALNIGEYFYVIEQLATPVDEFDDVTITIIWQGDSFLLSEIVTVRSE